MEKNEMEKTADKLEQLLHDGNKAYTEYCIGKRNCMVCPYSAGKHCAIRFLAEWLLDNGVRV